MLITINTIYFQVHTGDDVSSWYRKVNNELYVKGSVPALTLFNLYTNVSIAL